MNVTLGNSVEDDNGNHQTKCQVWQDAWGERRNTEEVLCHRASTNNNGNAYDKKRNAELGKRQRDSSEQRKTNCCGGDKRHRRYLRKIEFKQMTRSHKERKRDGNRNRSWQ